MSWSIKTCFIFSVIQSKPRLMNNTFAKARPLLYVNHVKVLQYTINWIYNPYYTMNQHYREWGTYLNNQVWQWPISANSFIFVFTSHKHLSIARVNASTIHIKYGLPYCVTCPSMSTDPGSLNPGSRRSRVPGWWDPGIRTNTGAGDTVLAKHT